MKAFKILKYSFASVGLILFAVAIVWAGVTSEFLKSAKKTEGIVMGLSLERSSSGSSTTSNKSYVYRPRVKFTADGNKVIEFVSSVGSNPPAYYEGEIVEVLYESDNPHNARINHFMSLWFGPLIFGFLGLVFTLIGGGMILVFYLQEKQDLYLRRHGTAIISKFDSIIENKRLTVNNRHPFQIITQWQNPSTGKIHLFKSKNIWFDPSNYIKGKDITVFIDKNNPNKHLVDLSFLPELAD